MKKEKFVETWKQYQPKLLAYARKCADTEGDDIVNKLFLELVSRKSLPKELSEQYLIHAVRSRWRNEQVRKKMMEKNRPNHFKTNIVFPQISDIERNEHYSELYSAFSQLPKQCQDVLHLTVVQGYDNATVSRILKTSNGTVRWAKSVGLNKLKELLKAV